MWSKMTQVDMFNMKHSKPKMRQAKHTIIPDIYHFGMSLVNRILSEEIRKVYAVKNNTSADPDPIQVTASGELENLVTMVMDIQNKYTRLEKDITKLKKENSELRVLVQRQISSTTSASAASSSTMSIPTAPLRAVTSHAVTSPVVTSPAVTSQAVTSTTSGVIASPSVVLEDQSCNTSNSSTDSDSDDETSFQPPAHYLKKLRRLEKRVKKLSCPTPVPQHTTPVNHADASKPALKAALSTNKRDSPSLKVPRGHKDLYIGGVSADNNVEDLKIFFKSQGIHNISNITPLSKKRDWQSFKVSLADKDFNKARKSNKWPSGITIRPFLASTRPANWGSSRYQKTRESTRIQAANSSKRHHDYYNEWPTPEEQVNRSQRNNQRRQRDSWDTDYNQYTTYHDSYSY